MNRRQLELILRMRDEVSDTMRRASRRVRADLASIQRAARGVGRTLRSVGRAITSDFGVGVARVLALAGAAAGKLHLDFQKALTPIVTLVGIGRSQVQEWRADILRLAGETARAPRELAEAMFVVTSAGARGSTALKILTAAARASAVGLGRTADIARSVVSAVTAYGEKVLTAAMATDVLTATVRAGNLEATELASRLGIVLPLASQLGVTFQEVGAFIATYTRLGVPVAVATTGLRGLLAAIIEPSDDARKAYAELGLTIDQVKDSIKSDGLQSVFANLIELTGGNVEVLGRLIPRVEGLTALLGTAAAQGETYAGVLDDINQSAGLAGDTFEQTAEEDWFKFEQAVNDAKIGLQGFGEVLAPVIQGFLGLPTPIQHAVFAMAALQVMSTLHLAPSLASLSGMLTTVATRALPLLAAAVATSSAVIVPAATAMWVALTGPIGLAIIALIAIGTAVYIFRDEIVGALSSVWNWVEDHWMDIGSILLIGLTGPLGLLLTNTFGLRDALIDAFESVVSFIGDFAGSAFSAAKDFGESVADGIMEGLDSLVSRVVDTGKGVANALIGMVNSGITVINDAIPDRIQIPGPLPDINLPNNPIPTIPMLQRGTDRFAGGSAIVGEDGPELVNVPAGSSVINAGDIRNLTNAVRSASAGGIGAAGSLGPAASVSPAADGQGPRLIRSQRRLSDSLDDLTETLDKRVVPIEREVARGLTEFDEAWLTQQDPGLAAARRNAWVEGLSGGLGGGGGGGSVSRVTDRYAGPWGTPPPQLTGPPTGYDDGRFLQRYMFGDAYSRSRRSFERASAIGGGGADIYGYGLADMGVTDRVEGIDHAVRADRGPSVPMSALTEIGRQAQTLGEQRQARARQSRDERLQAARDADIAGGGSRLATLQRALFDDTASGMPLDIDRARGYPAPTYGTMAGSMAIPAELSIEEKREAWLQGTYTPFRERDGAPGALGTRSVADMFELVPPAPLPDISLLDSTERDQRERSLMLARGGRSALPGGAEPLVSGFPATGSGDMVEKLETTMRKRLIPDVLDLTEAVDRSASVERKFSLDPFVRLQGDLQESGTETRVTTAFESARESMRRWLQGEADANPLDVMQAWGMTPGEPSIDQDVFGSAFDDARAAMDEWMNGREANPLDLMQAWGLEPVRQDVGGDITQWQVSFDEARVAMDEWMNGGEANPIHLMGAWGYVPLRSDDQVAVDQEAWTVSYEEAREAMGLLLDGKAANPIHVMHAYGLNPNQITPLSTWSADYTAERLGISHALQAAATPIAITQRYIVNTVRVAGKTTVEGPAPGVGAQTVVGGDPGGGNPLSAVLTPNVGSPASAFGGVAWTPQTRLVGEAGPEVITPLADFDSLGGQQPIIIYSIIELDGEKVGENVSEHMLGDALSSSGFSLQR